MYIHTPYVCWYTVAANKRNSSNVWMCYHTLPNSLGYDAMRYNDFNALPHVTIHFLQV